MAGVGPTSGTQTGHVTRLDTDEDTHLPVERDQPPHPEAPFGDVISQHRPTGEPHRRRPDGIQPNRVAGIRVGANNAPRRPAFVPVDEAGTSYTAEDFAAAARRSPGHGYGFRDSLSPSAWSTLEGTTEVLREQLGEDFRFELAVPNVNGPRYRAGGGFMLVVPEGVDAQTVAAAVIEATGGRDVSIGVHHYFEPPEDGRSFEPVEPRRFGELVHNRVYIDVNPQRAGHIWGDDGTSREAPGWLMRMAQENNFRPR